MDKNFYKNEIDHTAVLYGLSKLAQKYSELFLTTIGSSVMGKPIPAARIGTGEKKLLYVGCHHGMERITSAILIKFMQELCEHFSSGNMIYGIHPDYIFKTRTVYVIPMVNPDGAQIQLHGVDKDNIMYDRLFAMNRCDDFTHWQANIRGVDLNHNYNSGFNEYKNIEKELGIEGGCATRYSGQYPESEPETAAVCGFIRALAPFKYVFSFHTQGEEIYSGCRGYEPKGSLRTARTLARHSGYTLAEPQNAAAYGGLKDWYIEQYDAPAYTIECGKGENPLPPCELGNIYIALRKMLFHTLTL